MEIATEKINPIGNFNINLLYVNLKSTCKYVEPIAWPILAIANIKKYNSKNWKPQAYIY